MKANKETASEINHLHRALRVAALESFQNEVIDTEMYHLLIGANLEYPTKSDWVNDRINEWMEEAELGR